MGITTWPCPGCGQQQKVDHANGETVKPTLCAACAERKAKQDAGDDGA